MTPSYVFKVDTIHIMIRRKICETGYSPLDKHCAICWDDVSSGLSVNDIRIIAQRWGETEGPIAIGQLNERPEVPLDVIEPRPAIGFWYA